jgi:hypothetical protein
MPTVKFAIQVFDKTTGAPKNGITVTASVGRAGVSGAVATGLTMIDLGFGGFFFLSYNADVEGDWFLMPASAATDIEPLRGAWAAVEIPRIDAAVSSRLADADWTSGLASILAAISGVGTVVWSHITRTLTMTAAQVQAALTGSTLAITNRVTFSQEISNLTIPATWSKIFVTFKKSRDYPDAAAALQWVVSNPAAASTDGIAVYAGNPGGTSRTLGALTVDQPGGKITIDLQDDIDLALLAGDYEYDIKSLQADGSSVILTEAQGVINLAVTRAV